MNRNPLRFIVASVLLVATGTTIACEYKQGETEFLDYAICRYGKDSIEVVTLPKDALWEQCIFYLEAFRPPKLLAVTRTKDGKEVCSINDRTKIGNPCYMAKQQCDDALEFKTD
jgi:hypothetical protein